MAHQLQVLHLPAFLKLLATLKIMVCVDDELCEKVSVGVRNIHTTLKIHKVQRDHFPLVIELGTAHLTTRYMITDSVGNGLTQILKRLEPVLDNNIGLYVCPNNGADLLTSQTGLRDLLVQSAKKSFGAAGAYKSVHVSIFKYALGFPEGPPRFEITLDENVFAADVSLVTVARAPKEVLKLPFGITVDKAELGPGTNKQLANDDSGDYYLSDASGACKGGAVSDDPDGGDTSGDDEPIEHPIAPPADEPPPPPPIVPPVVPPVDVAIIAPPVAPAGPVRRALGLLSCSRAPPRSRAKCVLRGNRIMPDSVCFPSVSTTTMCSS